MKAPKAEKEKPVKAPKSDHATTSGMDAHKAELAAARGMLERSRPYSDAAMTLSKLEDSLAEHSAEVASLKQRGVRFEEVARRYIERIDGLRCLDSNPSKLAEDLIAGADLMELVDADRHPLEKECYRRLTLPEPEDLNLIKAIDRERAAVMVLQSAIPLQKKKMAAAQRQAMFELSRSLGGARATIARKVLALYKDLNELVAADRSLTEQLQPSELQLLKPKPFPMSVVSPDAFDWLLDCVQSGLIDASELTASGLR